MDIEDTEIPEVKIVRPPRFGDARGFFSETWSAAKFAERGLELAFCQDNHSFSAEKGTLRGLHFQIPPFAQDKLVRASRGAIWDVAVDIRRGSPAFGKWVGRVVSAGAWNQILVPAGFAHGFVTLEPDTEVQYKVTAPYAPEHERGVAWDDPDLAIDWPLDGAAPVLSARDRTWPALADAPDLFAYAAGPDGPGG